MAENQSPPIGAVGSTASWPPAAGVVVTTLLVAAAFFAGGVWAARTVLTPPDDPFDVPTETQYTVQTAHIEESVTLTALAESPERVAANFASSGTVTSMAEHAGPVSTGDQLLTIDLQPVVIAAGQVPAFRPLTQGTEGRDVKQLEHMLVSLGYLESEPDDVFDSATRSAVEDWQEQQGMPETGEVPLGWIVFVPDLPRSVRLHESIAVGAAATPGTPLLYVADGDAQVTVPIGPDQRTLAPVGTSAYLEAKGGPIAGAVVDIRDAESGGVELVIGEVDVTAVCDGACTGSPVEIPVRLVTIAPVDGPAVPVSALRSGGDGSTYVITPEAREVPVTVIGSDGALAVVDGLNVGDIVVVESTEVP